MNKMNDDSAQERILICTERLKKTESLYRSSTNDERTIFSMMNMPSSIISFHFQSMWGSSMDGLEGSSRRLQESINRYTGGLKKFCNRKTTRDLIQTLRNCSLVLNLTVVFLFHSFLDFTSYKTAIDSVEQIGYKAEIA